MALGNNYLTYNSTALPNPDQMTIDYENVENVVRSEAGTDMAIVTRLQKRIFTCTFNVTSAWLATIKAICATTSGTLGWNGETFTVMARISNASLQPYSEHLARTNGLYVITVTFTEV